MERIKLGTLYLDWLINRIMIMLEWEIELWLSGKDKDITTSQHVLLQQIIQI